MDCRAKYGSMVCTTQSVDCTNPYFVPNIYIYIYISRNTYFKNHKRPRSTVCMSCTSVLFVSCMYLDGGMGGGGWLLTSFFSIIYILGLVCYKHTIHVFIVYCVGRSKTPRVLYITYWIYMVYYYVPYIRYLMRVSKECEIAFFLTGFAKFLRALISRVHTSVYYYV